MIFTLAAVLLSKCIVLLLEHFFGIFRVLTVRIFSLLSLLHIASLVKTIFTTISGKTHQKKWSNMSFCSCAHWINHSHKFPSKTYTLTYLYFKRFGHCMKFFKEFVFPMQTVGIFGSINAKHMQILKRI
uniref:Secreted protein n=1 Tax=Ascaris lumbricoides TaxID=6252 RepID=A0A0M3I8P0_ASCLU